jgi:hypothetical protein
VVDTALLQCSGLAERHAAMIMAERVEGVERITLAADKGYDTKDFVKEMGNARSSVESSGSLVIHSTTPFSV